MRAASTKAATAHTKRTNHTSPHSAAGSGSTHSTFQTSEDVLCIDRELSTPASHPVAVASVRSLSIEPAISEEYA